jgi:DnaK suppressor protein
MAQSSTSVKLQSDRLSGITSTPEIKAHYPEFIRSLWARRDELIGLERKARADVEEQVMSSPGDLADESVVDTSLDYFLNRANTHHAELIEIQDALDRIDRGVYGMCESCENPIPIERLRHLPYARLDIACQTTLERTRLRSVPRQSTY